MLFRLVGLVLSMGIVGYLLYSVLASDSKVNKALDNNSTVIEQKKALQNAGVPTDNKKQLKSYVDQQAKQLEEYQHSADGLKGE